MPRRTSASRKKRAEAAGTCERKFSSAIITTVARAVMLWQEARIFPPRVTRFFAMLAPAFVRLPHPNPTADDVRAAAIADPQFGRVFTDHMVSIRYKEGIGWHDAKRSEEHTSE